MSMESQTDRVMGRILPKYEPRHPDGSVIKTIDKYIFTDNNYFLVALLSGQIDCVREVQRAATLLLPLRLEILRLAREPASSSDLAARLGLPRQRVHYHVQLLARAGFLRRAGRRRRRNMIEQRYVASAVAFLLSPELLGSVGPDWRRVGDPGSGAYLLALASQMEADLIRTGTAKPGSGEKETVLTLKSQFRFVSPAQREQFTAALREAVVGVIARHTSPASEGPTAKTYRLVLGCYPYLPETGAPPRPA
jgi:DNA-binding transcriptional ArsR family regulator